MTNHFDDELKNAKIQIDNSYFEHTIFVLSFITVKQSKNRLIN
jgi:hypothetical protein